MRTIKLSDITMKQSRISSLTFRDKLKLVEYLDRLFVDTIEISPLDGSRTDILCAKSFAQIIKNASLAVPVGLSKESADQTFNSIKEAVSYRLQVVCPVSSVQMEYLYHLKPEAMQKKIAEIIEYCKTLCSDIEFIALDATRSDKSFLYSVIDTAVNFGATKITVSDDAGVMMPEEYKSYIEDIFANSKALSSGKATLAVACSNKLALADICSIEAVNNGAFEIKASVLPVDSASLESIIKIISAKGDALGLKHNVKTVELQRITEKINRMLSKTKNSKSPFENKIKSNKEANTFTKSDDFDVIIGQIKQLGYDLSDNDNKVVYDTFKQIASKKENVTTKELEVIIATSAMQVPPTYTLEDFIINAGNIISATCHIRLTKKGKLLEGVAIGDGPVDASYLAIENITGHHYELDDFQIQALTEGRTAMGETIVKLRADGKLYSGHGISNDIIASSIHAYINALNKIAYEEENS